MKNIMSHKTNLSSENILENGYIYIFDGVELKTLIEKRYYKEEA